MSSVSWTVGLAHCSVADYTIAFRERFLLSVHLQRRLRQWSSERDIRNIGGPNLFIRDQEPYSAPLVSLARRTAVTSS